MSAPANIVIYTTAVCPYCVAAKNFLQSKGQTWEEVRVDTNPDIRRKMTEMTGRTSVPQIFINDTHVGGFDDLVAADRSGKLAELLGASA